TCSVIVPDVPEGTLECDAYYPWGLDTCQNTKTVTVSGENHAPQVTLVSPEQWQVFEDEFNIHFEWSTYDDDGDTVTSELHILNDNTGEEWEYDVGTGASFDWTAPDYDEYSWWVVVNDGTYTTESERWPFMIIRSEQIRVLSPENNTLFIQPTHNGDMDITVEWSGPDGDYDLCIQNADGSGSPECSTATGHSGTVTLKDTVGYTAEDYKIWVEHDGEVSEPVIVSYKDDVKVVAPVAVFFGMEDDKLVCRGKVIARDDRAIGQTRSASVAILKLNPYDALINNHSDLIINDDSSYIEASVDDPESGDYKCNVGVTLLTGPSDTYDFATYTVAKALQIPIKPKPNFKPKPISLPTTLPVKPVKPEPIKPTSIISTPEKNKSISTMTSTQIKKPTSINYKLPVSSIFVKPVKNDDTKKGLTMFNYAHIKTNKHQ
ncbi:hypothetical protein J7J90_04080, partial [Candidatus Micrarchaeota archaeon]|nr:hypothetical protein [Candidatus Micrarchaeota archaeon]